MESGGEWGRGMPPPQFSTPLRALLGVNLVMIMITIISSSTSAKEINFLPLLFCPLGRITPNIIRYTFDEFFLCVGL